MGSGVLSRYSDHLPLTQDTPLVSLGEGDTPLVRARQLANSVGCAELYLKLEGCNPTGSFKDRGMVLAVAKAMENGSSSIICASTGNTSASAAAYGAYCGLDTIVLVPKGDVSKAKLAQAMAYGARIFTVQGRFDQALEIVRDFTERHHVSLVNSVNPYRLEGQKTAAFEIVDELGQAPDLLCIPVGNAGNITAYWKGFVEYEKIGKSTRLPRMMGFQAEGAAPIVRGVAVADPRTVASAIRIGNPASWNGALKARDESDGVIDSVSDEEILTAYRLLAQKEGVFCEPASAASLAGLLKLSQNGVSLAGKQVVCVITGNGLKDTDLAVQTFGGELQEVGASLLEVEEALLVSGIETQIR
jgi:threonine synthase